MIINYPKFLKIETTTFSENYRIEIIGIKNNY